MVYLHLWKIAMVPIKITQEKEVALGSQGSRKAGSYVRLMYGISIPYPGYWIALVAFYTENAPTLIVDGNVAYH
jgi:hypothetical protein